jgi:uncharacterized protein (TIGR01777 family)
VRSRDSALRFVVSGATGLVGEALIGSLTGGGHEVVRLVRTSPARAGDVRWAPHAGELDPTVIEGADVVVNLSGENVAGGRWSAERRRAIRTSRLEGTALLARTMAAAKKKPSSFVSASAVGYYGDAGDTLLDESSPNGGGFLAEVCRGWEAATTPASDAGVRTVLTRIGVVLAAGGGALAKMSPPFRLGLGGPMGGGEHWMSCIDIADAVAAIQHVALAPSLSGPVNLVCPEPLRNADFTRALGEVLRRPAFLPMPAFAIKAAMGDMGREVLLSSQRVTPAKLKAAGFTFACPDVPSSLARQLAAS